MTKQPISSDCFVCGVENPHGLHLSFDETVPGEVSAHFTALEHWQGYPGMVHGGIIAAMLDEATGRSLMAKLPTGFAFTAQLNIRYRKPVPIGQPLRLLGHAGEHRGKVSHATGEIVDLEGTVLVSAEAVLVDVPEERVAGMNPEQLGWRVNPDEEESA
jgi:acyl-coenzyme A thioesterase PaaI-like protein